MSVNKFLPHVFVIPEDRADEQVANGFVNHDQVSQKQIQVLPCETGWRSVLDKFQSEYIPYLRKYQDGHLIMLIDFDGQYVNRRLEFAQAVPADLMERVFVIGAKTTPEALKKELGRPFEPIGEALAEDCFRNAGTTWAHEHLRHNDPDLRRLASVVRPFLFPP